MHRARQHAFPVLLALGVEDPRGGLVAERPRMLRMTRRVTAELAEALERLRRGRGAGEVQERAEQHRALATRKDEATGPTWIAGAVLEEIAPWRLGDVRHARRHSGAPRIGARHRMHRQSAKAVGELTASGHAACAWRGVRGLGPHCPSDAAEAQSRRALRPSRAGEALRRARGIDTVAAAQAHPSM
jgi:hypothetical protein